MEGRRLLKMDSGELYEVVTDLNRRIESLTSNSQIDSTVSDEINQIQRISRNNYILNFTFDQKLPLTTFISLEKIFESIRAEPKTFTYVIPNTNVLSCLNAGVNYAYTNPHIFAQYLAEYFESNPLHVPLFAYITFPALFGFFISEEQLPIAYDVIDSVFRCGKFELGKHLLVSFLSSSYSFLDTFWRNFFQLINYDDFQKPSLAQLVKYLIDTLENTFTYFSPNHIALLMSLLTLDSIAFCECFFERFLLPSYSTWISYNPALCSSKITSYEIETLFSFLKDKTETDTMELIQMSLSKAAFSFCETISIFDHTKSNRVICLLSPIEMKILFNIFEIIPDLASKKPKLTSVKNWQVVFENFSPVSFEISINKNDQKTDEYLLLSKVTPIQVPNENSESESKWNFIVSICKHYNQDPVEIMMHLEHKPEDTINTRKAKNKVQPVVNEKLRTYVLATKYNKFIDKQNVFEEYLCRLHIAEKLKHTKTTLKQYNQLLANKFMSYLSQESQGMFPELYARTKLIEEEFNIEYKKAMSFQYQFEALLESFSIEDSKLIEFISKKEKFLTAPVQTLSRFDEISLADRLLVITQVYSAIESMSPNPEWSMSLFVVLLKKTKIYSFFSLLISMIHIIKTNKEIFDALPKVQKERWMKIQNFFQAEFISKFHYEEAEIGQEKYF